VLLAQIQDRQLKFEQRFDILNNKPKYREEEDDPAETQTEKSKAKPQSSSSCKPHDRDFDIVSNQPFSSTRSSTRYAICCIFTYPLLCTTK
jgi:hypothetical protein